MPRFSLKNAWLALTLVAFGITLLALVLKPTYPGEPDHSELADGIMWFVGGTLIGAGLMTPLGHPFIGAAIGFLIQFILGWIFAVHLAGGLNALYPCLH